MRILLLTLVWAASGCTVDPFCIVADEAGRGGDGGQPSCESGAEELCNGRDDDCDGEVDEGFDLRADGEHCGRCGNRCELPRAISACVDGTCVVSSCIPGSVDADGAPENGCEAPCGIAPAPASEHCDGADCCDGADNDCDGLVDEDHDLSADPDNCGGCAAGCESWPCPFLCHAPFAATSCVDGACRIDDCDDGHHDLDGQHANGCEYACFPSAETAGREDSSTPCNGRDDDCDGETDEEFAGQGDACGGGDGCATGALACVEGRLSCVAEEAPPPEECNGVDDDCDGEVDEDPVDEGQPCGSDPDGCIRGTSRCEEGALVCDESRSPEGLPCDVRTGGCAAGAYACVDGVFACVPAVESCDGLDDDCDGRADEGIPLGNQCGAHPEEWGYEACRSGEEVCVGYRPLRDEVCDGEDNDGDGEFDEGASCLEPRARCVDGRCLLPCSDGGDDASCPAGTTCGPNGCDGPLCSGARCSECERCDPSSGLCVDRCAGLSCPAGLICHCGRCWPPSCRLLGCPEGEVCRDGLCESDPCATAGCSAEQGCADGLCFDPCRPYDCGSRERCHRGQCQDDPCSRLSCPAGECDPETGECAFSCVGVNCLAGMVCELASGQCIDDPCLAVSCPEGSSCVDGSCVVADAPVEPDGGVDDDAGLPDGGPSPDRLCIAGAGGCACSSPGTGTRAEAAVVFLVLVCLGRARIRR